MQKWLQKKCKISKMAKIISSLQAILSKRLDIFKVVTNGEILLSKQKGGEKESQVGK